MIRESPLQEGALQLRKNTQWPDVVEGPCVDVFGLEVRYGHPASCLRARSTPFTMFFSFSNASHRGTGKNPQSGVTVSRSSATTPATARTRWAISSGGSIQNDLTGDSFTVAEGTPSPRPFFLPGIYEG